MEHHLPRRVSKSMVWLLLACSLMAGSCLAGVPTTLSFQGRLAQPDGSAMTGAVELSIRLYDQEIGGAALHTEVTTAVLSSQGVFVVSLGESTPLPLASMRRPLFVGVSAEGGQEMQPRIRVASVPYALFSRAAESLESRDMILLTTSGTALERGEALRDAIARLGAGTSEQPKQVMLGPGTYDLGSEPIDLPDHFGLVGMGSQISKVTCAGQASARATVNITGATRLADLRIESTAGGAYSIAVRVVGARGSELADILAYGRGGSQTTIGLQIVDAPGAAFPGETMRVDDVSSWADGDGSLVVGLDVVNSRIESTSIDPLAGDWNGAPPRRMIGARLVNSELRTLYFLCSSWQAYAGSAENIGLELSGGWLESAEGEIEVIPSQTAPSTVSYGVRIQNGARAELRNMTISTRGMSAGSPVGIDVQGSGSSLDCRNCEIRSSTTPVGGGIALSASAGDIWIRDSTLDAPVVAVQAAAPATLHIVSSHFRSGTVSGTATVDCAYVYSGDMQPVGITGCP